MLGSRHCPPKSASLRGHETAHKNSKEKKGAREQGKRKEKTNRKKGTTRQYTKVLFKRRHQALALQERLPARPPLSRPYGCAPNFSVSSTFFPKLIRSLPVSHDLGAWDLAIRMHLIMLHGLPSMSQTSSHIADTSRTSHPLFSVALVTAFILRFSCMYYCSVCL